MTLIIYFHFPCLDGLAAAYAAKSSVHETVEFIGYNTNSPPNLDVHKNVTVYFLDCAPTRVAYEALLNNGNCVRILDHHVGNKRELEDVMDANTLAHSFDLTKAGCERAWRFFHDSDDPLPELFRRIGERDLGNMKDHRHLGFALMRLNLKTIEEMGVLVKRGEEAVRELEEQGRKIEADFEARAAELMPESAPYGPFNVRLAKVRDHMFVSELAERLYDDEHSFVCMWHAIDKDKFKLYLRTNHDDVDLSEVAKEFGGNGHAKAAGAVVSVLPFVTSM